MEIDEEPGSALCREFQLIQEKFPRVHNTLRTRLQLQVDTKSTEAMLHVVSSDQVLTLKPESLSEFHMIEQSIQDFPSTLVWLEQLVMPGSQSARLSIPLLVSEGLSPDACGDFVQPIVRYVLSTLTDATNRTAAHTAVMMTFQPVVLATMKNCVAKSGRAIRGVQLVVLSFPSIFVDFTALQILCSKLDVCCRAPIWHQAVAAGVMQPAPRTAVARRFVKSRRTSNARTTSTSLVARPVSAAKAHELSILLEDSSCNLMPPASQANDVHLVGQACIADAIAIRKRVLRYRFVNIVSSGWRDFVALSPETCTAISNWLESVPAFQGVSITRYMASVSPSSGYMTSIAFQLDKRVCLNTAELRHDGRGSNTVLRVDRSGAWITCQCSQPGRQWPDRHQTSPIKCQDFARKNTQRALLPLISDELRSAGLHVNHHGLLQLPATVLAAIGLCNVEAERDPWQAAMTNQAPQSVEDRAERQTQMQIIMREGFLSPKQLADVQKSNSKQFAAMLSVRGNHMSDKFIHPPPSTARSWFIAVNSAFQPCNNAAVLLDGEGMSQRAAPPDTPQEPAPPTPVAPSAAPVPRQRFRHTTAIANSSRGMPGISCPATPPGSPAARRRRPGLEADPEEAALIRLGHPLLDFVMSYKSDLILSRALVQVPHWRQQTSAT